MSEPGAPAASEIPEASARDAIARAKGMPGTTITGGDDPELATELERERPWVRLLLIMIVVISVGGFVLGAVTALFGGLLGG